MTLTNRGKKLCDSSGVSRRQALKIGARGLGLGLLGSGLGPLPPLFGVTSEALARHRGQDPGGLRVVRRLRRPEHVRAVQQRRAVPRRPTIGVREPDVIKADEHFGFQKSMVGMHRLWEEGNCAVIHGCGYEQPSFSTSPPARSGTPARPTAARPTGGTAGRPTPSIRRGRPTSWSTSPRRSRSRCAHEHVPVVFNDPGSFRRDFFHPQSRHIDRLGNGQAPRSEIHKFLLDVNQSARDASALVSQAWDNYTSTRGDVRLLDLDKVVALIENDFPARPTTCGCATACSTPTSTRRARTTARCSTAATPSGAFFEEMKRLGKQDEVAVFIHSEFGRRVPENTSLGTDHGTANVAFVLGGGVKGGQYGKPVSLTDLVLGDNLQYTTDFRRVYATLIDEYLGLFQIGARAGRQVRDARDVCVKLIDGAGFGQPLLLAAGLHSNRFRMFRSSTTSSRSCGLPARCFMEMRSSIDATKNVR